MAKIVSFSKTRKYKIILFSSAGLGVLFLIMGLIFSIRGNVPTVTSLEITASGGEWLNGIYRIEVTERVTPIRVDAFTSVGLSGQPVTFTFGESGEGLVTFTSSVRSGDVNYLTLVSGQNGLPFFHEAHHPDNRIEINVNAGIQSAQIHVFIRLSQDNVAFTTRAERYVNTPFGPQWESVDTISELEFRNAPMSFRVFSEIRISGFTDAPVRFNTNNNFSMFVGKGEALSLAARDVVLFHPTTQRLSIPQGFSAGETLTFKITINLGGGTWFDFLELDIVQ